MSNETVFIYSTLAADTAYAFYEDGVGGMKITTDKIVIKGGANVADKNFVTPLGVVTQVSKDQADRLREHRVFKKHLDGGFVFIYDEKKDPEKVISAEGMQTRDVSAPMVPNDVESDGGSPLAETSKGGKNSKKK